MDENSSPSFRDPIVLWFSIVGILCALTAILGLINMYICHLEKIRRRAAVSADKHIVVRKKPVTRKTHVQINMSRRSLTEPRGSFVIHTNVSA